MSILAEGVNPSQGSLRSTGIVIGKYRPNYLQYSGETKLITLTIKL